MIQLKNFLFRIKLSFLFYRKLIISSAVLTLILIFFENPLELIFLVKIFLIGLIFLNFRFFEAKDKLLFYKNFGITRMFLFGYTVFLDLALTVLLFKLSNLQL